MMARLLTALSQMHTGSLPVWLRLARMRTRTAIFLSAWPARSFPRLNYKCFSGLELQDIMKQCSTLRGNYPAALLPLCSLAR